MRVHLAYGQRGLDVDLPDHAHVILPEKRPPLPDPGAAVREALREPIQSPPLKDLVRPGQRAAVLFSDITRPAPNEVILPPLLVELEDAGVRRQDITLINALGMHRRNTDDELTRMLGEELVGRYRILQHDPQDSSRLTHLFDNDRGARVEISSVYLDADIRILTGFVEPHIFAGYSGGGKAVLPGVAGAESVMSNHTGPMIAHPKATWCSAQGNPIFQEMRSVALATRPTMLLNVTLNERKQITAVFAGELAAAHDAGIEFAKAVYVRPVPHRFDIAVTTNSGYPADINLYQSYKGLSVAAQGVRDGGAVVLASECPDGLGLPHFRDLLSTRSTPAELLQMIEDPFFRHFDQWGVQIGAMVQVRVRSYLYSGMSAEETRRAHMIPCADVAATVTSLGESHRRNHGGEDPSILVLPYGQLTVPKVAG
jgi:nickel-dependent lactate racemase